MITNSKSNAFLLIEVLVTVVIVSVSIIIINHAFSSSLKATRLSNEYLKAISLLEDKSFDFEIDPVSILKEASGDAEYDGGKFYWEEAVSELEKEELTYDYEEIDLGLNKLTFSTGWQEQAVKRNIEIITYVIAKETDE